MLSDSQEFRHAFILHITICKQPSNLILFLILILFRIILIYQFQEE